MNILKKSFSIFLFSFIFNIIFGTFSYSIVYANKDHEQGVKEPNATIDKIVGFPNIEKISWFPMGVSSELQPAGKRINSLAIGPTGSIWVGTDEGLSRYHNGIFQHFTTHHGLTDENVNRLIRWGNGIAVNTTRGLSWIHDPPYENPTFVPLKNGAIGTLAVNNNRLWYGGISLDKWPKILFGYFTLDSDHMPLSNQNEVPTGFSNLINKVKHSGPVKYLFPGPSPLLLMYDTAMDLKWINGESGSLDEKNLPYEISNIESSIQVDDSAYMIISGRLIKFDSKEEYREIKLPGNQTILFLTQDLDMKGNPTTNTWVAMERELILVDKDGIVRNRHGFPKSVKVKSMAKDLRGRFWLGTENGLFVGSTEGLTILEGDSVTSHLKQGAEKDLISGSSERHSILNDDSEQDTEEDLKPLKLTGFFKDGKAWKALSNQITIWNQNGEIDKTIDLKDNFIAHVFGEDIPQHILSTDGLLELTTNGIKLIHHGFKSQQEMDRLREEDLRKLVKDNQFYGVASNIPGLEDALEIAYPGGYTEDSYDSYDSYEIDVFISKVSPLLDHNWDKLRKRNLTKRFLKELNKYSYEISGELLLRYPKNGNVQGIELIDIASPNKDPVQLPLYQRLRSVKSVITFNKKGDLFLLDGNNRLSILLSDTGTYKPSDHDFSLNYYEDIHLQQQLSISKDEYRSFVWTPNELWIHTDNDQWDSLLKLSKTEIRALNFTGMLPDKDEKGFLLGFWGGSENRGLVHVNTEGERILPFEINNCGNGKNAFFRDSGEREWIACQTTLFIRQPGNDNFETVINESTGLPFEEHVNEILEYPEGRLWFANYDSIWIKDEDSDFIKLDVPISEYISLALLKDEKETRILACDNHGTMLSIDPLSQEFEDLSIITRDILRPDNLFSTIDNGKDLLISNAEGVKRIHHNNLESVTLPGFQAKGDYSRSLLLKSRSKGIALMFEWNDYDDGSTYSSVWVKPPDSSEFIHVKDFNESTLVVPKSSEDGFFLGTLNRIFYSLTDKGELDLLWDTTTIKPNLEAFTSIASVDDETWLLMGNGIHTFTKKKGMQPQYISDSILPWAGAIDMGDGYIMLIHQSAASLFRLKDNNEFEYKMIPFEDKISHPIYTYCIGPEKRGKKDIYIVAEQWLWIFDKETGEFKKIDEVPVEEKDLIKRCLLIIEKQGVWLATGSGLWRGRTVEAEEEKSVSSIEWSQPVGTHEQQEVTSITNTKNDDEVLAFTPAGPLMGRKQNEGWWSFSPETGSGLQGERANDIEMFRFDETNFIAIATDQGVNIAYCPLVWETEDIEKLKWLYIDKKSGLLDNNVTTLHWSETGKHLYIGTTKGINIISLKNGAEGMEYSVLPESCKKSIGLPEGNIIEIKSYIDINENRNLAWIVIHDAMEFNNKNEEYRFLLWDIDANHVVQSNPIPFAGVRKAIMGPVIDKTPPIMLVSDSEKNESLLRMDEIIEPKITMTKFFGFVNASPMIGSFNDMGKPGKEWDINWYINRVNNPSIVGPYVWPQDFWKKTGPHLLIVQLYSHKTKLRYTTSTLLPLLEGSLERSLRLALVFSPLVILLSTGAVLLIKRHRKNIRIKRKENPYKVGTAVKNPEMCFGRKELLKALINTIAEDNWALIGEFRIGKSTIQWQFNSILNNLDDPKYRYIPIFIDFQKFVEQEDKDLFRYLGNCMAKFAKVDGVPDSTLEDLDILKEEEREYYDSDAFTNDMDLLLDHWSGKYSPKQPVLVLQIDEFQLVESMKIKYGKLSALRAILVSHENIKAILSGVKLPYMDTEQVISSPWYNIFTLEKVEPLTDDAARQLITNPAEGIFSYEKKAINFIIDVTQGRPEQIQKVCRNVVNYKYTRRLMGRITLNQVKMSRQNTKTLEQKENS